LVWPVKIPSRGHGSPKPSGERSDIEDLGKTIGTSKQSREGVRRGRRRHILFRGFSFCLKSRTPCSVSTSRSPNRTGGRGIATAIPKPRRRTTPCTRGTCANTMPGAPPPLAAIFRELDLTSNWVEKFYLLSPPELATRRFRMFNFLAKSVKTVLYTDANIYTDEYVHCQRATTKAEQ
jgi:hypothetical protein